MQNSQILGTRTLCSDHLVQRNIRRTRGQPLQEFPKQNGNGNGRGLPMNWI